jgi:hypothetical protein
MSGPKKTPKKKRAPARPATKRKFPEPTPATPLQLRVALTGDQRLAENVIVELLAAARRHGLEAPKVQILRKPRVGPKQALPARRKAK